jgi:hypothetical protein
MRVLAVVEHRAQPQRALEVTSAAFDGQQLLVGGGQVVGGEGEVGGAQQPLAVQVGLPLDRAVVDPQQPGGGAAQVAAQPGLGLEAADEFVTAPRSSAVGALDQLLEVRDEVRPHRGVAVTLLGVVADHEPLGAGALVTVPAGGHCDFLDPQGSATVW